MTTSVIVVGMVVLSSCAAKLGTYTPNHVSNVPKAEMPKNGGNNGGKGPLVSQKPPTGPQIFDGFEEEGPLDKPLTGVDQYEEIPHAIVYFAFD